MYNPPPMLSIAMLFGAMSYETAKVVWLCLLGISLISSVAILWDLAGGSPRRLGIALAVSMWFAPTMFALYFGQVSVFILLGLALFLRFEQSGNYFLAGAAAFALCIKPHLVYLATIAMIVWALRTRCRSFFRGVAFAGAVAVLPMLFNPGVYFEYWEVFESRTIQQYATSTVGSLARLVLDRQDQFSLQFLPVSLGFFFLTVRLIRTPLRLWDWQRELPGLVVVSLATSVYGWVNDQVLLLVALVPLLACGVRQGGMASWAGGVGGAVIVGVPLVQAFLGVNTVWYFWIPWLFIPITWMIPAACSADSEARSDVV